VVHENYASPIAIKVKQEIEYSVVVFECLVLICCR